jgi:hypothetical protein
LSINSPPRMEPEGSYLRSLEYAIEP